MLMEWFLLCPPIEQVLFLLHMDAHTRQIRMWACVAACPTQTLVGVLSPVILQSRRKVGVSPPKPFRTGSELLFGTGMVMVMGLWNFLRRGSKVTMGLKVALLPRIFFITSTLTGWVWESGDLTFYCALSTLWTRCKSTFLSAEN